MMTFTIAEALDALAKATGPLEEGVPPNTYPMWQVAEALGCGKEAIHRYMREWLAAGDVQVVTYRKRGLDGRLMTLKGFQFKAPVKAVAKRKKRQGNNLRV